MNVAKKRTLRGDEDGPGQKRFAHTTQQVQGASTKKEARTIGFGEVVWSGKLEFHDVHKQKRFLSSGYVHSHEKINTVNWPKQLKMTTIPFDVYLKLLSPHVVRATQRVHVHVDFSVDEDCDKMSRRAFIQSTCWPNWGCALLEYTSSVISLLFLTSYSLGNENVTFGFIHKYTYQDRVVEFLADFGILSHATTANMLVEQKMRHQEEVEMLKTLMAEKEKEHARVMEKQIIEKDRALSEKDEKLIEQHRALSEKDEGLIEKDKALSEKDEKLIEQHRALSQKDQEIKAKDRALLEKQSELIVKDITLMEKEERLFEKQRALSDLKQEQNELQHEKDKVEEQLQMCQRALNNAQHLDAERDKTIVQPNIEEDTDKILETETSRLELVNEVNRKKAALDDIGEMIENEFKCSICAQLFIKTTTLNCSHSFCAYCIQKWLDEKRTCPNCRLMTTSSVRSVVIDNCIEKIVNKLGHEAKQRRKETVREREETISTERYGQPYVILDDDDESDDQSSTVTSPSSSTTYLRSPASTMSTYHPSPASTMSTYHPSPASSYWRSPSSIANMFSPPSVSSTNTASPAAT